MGERDVASEDRLRWQRPLAWIAAVTVAGTAAISAWLVLRGGPDRLDEVVTVDAAGDTLVYSGPVRDAIARAQIIEAFNSVAAPAADTGGAPSEPDSVRDRAAAEAREARRAAIDALARLYGDAPDPDAIIAALDLAIIDFPEGSARLPTDAAGFIQSAAEVIERAPEGAVFLVAGHATDGATEAEDLALSDERARAVVSALVGAGVHPERLRLEGHGSRTPDEDAVAENRQIVFRLLARGEQEEAESAAEDDAAEDGTEDAATERDATG